jgi:lipoate-protein ligase B
VSGSPKVCYAVTLGTVGYLQALDLQMRICAAKKEGFAPDVILLLEHPPTITLGRSGEWHNLLVPDEVLRARGVTRCECDRGGDITFHGPGQLVGYPLLQLERNERDVHRYMRNLEETLIRSLAAFGIEAGRAEKFTGVWTARGKIAAMGVHISRWITRHGFALNVWTDLSYFDLIHPCGIVGRSVTSMESILGSPVDFARVLEQVAVEFGRVFQREMVEAPAEILNQELEIFWHNKPLNKNVTSPQAVVG